MLMLLMLIACKGGQPPQCEPGKPCRNSELHVPESACHDTAVFVDNFDHNATVHCRPDQHVEVSSSASSSSGAFTRGKVGFVIACKCKSP